jgi:hypothetical protein
MKEIIADCGYIKGYALTIGQALRGDFEGSIQGAPPGFSDNPSIETLKLFAQQMAELSAKVNQYVQGLK